MLVTATPPLLRRARCAAVHYSQLRRAVLGGEHDGGKLIREDAGQRRQLAGSVPRSAHRRKSDTTHRPCHV